jgi:glycosyltransferase involved in cell wall biosynthesis
MKKKIFLIVSSLGAGGSERVYWLLSQYFNKEEYEVSVIYLNALEQCFDKNISGINFIDLKTIKASRSFFKLYKLIRKEKPFAVFSTTDHINILTAIVSCFVKIPNLIARISNNPQQMKLFYGFKTRFYNLFTKICAIRFDFIVCQSEEMLQSVSASYGIRPGKLKVIHNPINETTILKNHKSISGLKRLIIVSRLTKEKGIFRLLEIIKELPQNYVLTIVGDGPLMTLLKAKVSSSNLENRVVFKGEINDVSSQISKHDLLVLSSFTEGFPNVILDALSVGVPVVTFRVGGVKELIREGFNGFIAEQDDTVTLRRQIIRACNQAWQHDKIKADINGRFALDTIGRAYENLLLQ